MRSRETWVEIFRALGESVISVVKAELAVVGEDWKDTAKKVGILLGLVVVVLGMLVAIIQIAFYASIHGLAALAGWPLWGAGFAVCAAGLLLIALIGTVAYFTIIRKLKNPLESASQRVGDHFAWWQQQFISDERRIDDGGEFDEQPEIGP